MGRLRIAGLGLGLTLAAAALGADAQGIAPQASGPMDISADSSTFVNEACESTWSGAAEVLQGTTRLRANTIEAAEQCDRTALPELTEPVKLTALLKSWDAGRTLLFADETGGQPIADVATSGPTAILIGPEGGFTPDERALIRAAPGATGISLGPRILRAETAAAAAISAWMSKAGDWR